MGSVYRKTVTKPLPAGAEIFTRKNERFARWKNTKGRTRTAALTIGNDDSERIVITASTFTAKYRDGAGVVREVATGCKDETAARSVLRDLERRAELVKAGVMTSTEDAVADHQATPLVRHFTDYSAHLTAKGVTRERIKTTDNRLQRVAADRGFGVLADINAGALEGWLNARAVEGMSAGARNGYREAYVGFANWCRRSRRLVENPLSNVPKADAKADCRRKRRSMTEAELILLLDVARHRPLKDARTIRRGKRRGESVANLSPEVVKKLERLGRERALIYKALVLTGLRKGELASLTVGQLELDGAVPVAILHAADEKNREGSQIVLRADLAADLASWVDELRQAHMRNAAGSQGQNCLQMTPAPRTDVLPADTPLFTVPSGLVRILDRDLKAAGIAKSDERGRTLDVHALRHTFGTLLSKGGVAPRTAMAAMRHGSIDLTMSVYTDPKLLDVAGAVNSLPSLPLNEPPASERITARATGTDDSRIDRFAPRFAPNADVLNPSRHSLTKQPSGSREHNEPFRVVVSNCADKQKHPSTSTVKGCHEVGATRFELATSTSRT